MFLIKHRLTFKIFTKTSSYTVIITNCSFCHIISHRHSMFYISFECSGSRYSIKDDTLLYSGIDKTALFLNHTLTFVIPTLFNTLIAVSLRLTLLCQVLCEIFERRRTCAQELSLLTDLSPDWL